jgi:hypothetical protein
VDRKEAIAFLRELQSYCTDMNPDRLSLDLSLDDSNIYESSVGYRIQIKGTVDSDCREFIKTAASKRKLAVKEESDKITIFKPR